MVYYILSSLNNSYPVTEELGHAHFLFLLADGEVDCHSKSFVKNQNHMLPSREFHISVAKEIKNSKRQD